MVLFIIVLAITVAQFKWNQHQESLGGEKDGSNFSKILESKNEKSEKVTPGGILVIILLTLLALITLVPFIWMVSASFKTNNEVFTIPIQWIPKSWHRKLFRYLGTHSIVNFL